MTIGCQMLISDSFIIIITNQDATLFFINAYFHDRYFLNVEY